MIDWFVHLAPPVQAAIVAGVVSLAVSVATPFLTALLQDRQQRRNARLSYEFDARKQLYAKLEPLLFKLFEAAEGSFHMVRSLVRNQKSGHLGSSPDSWLPPERDGARCYYMNSTVYRLFLPLAVFRLMQRSATLLDLALDRRIQLSYFILKTSHFTFTDDFVLAKIAPEIDYDADNPSWKELRKTDESRYWRQGLPVGRLDRLIDTLLNDQGAEPRLRTFGEFEEIVRNDRDIKGLVEPAFDIFEGFAFHQRPVLARILLSHACLMRLLLAAYREQFDPDEAIAALQSFARSKEAADDLDWTQKEGPVRQSLPWNCVVSYLSERLRWLSPDYYAIESESGQQENAES